MEETPSDLGDEYCSVIEEHEIVISADCNSKYNVL